MIKYCNKCECDTERYLSGDCKPCARKRAAIYRVNNPEKTKALVSEWRKKNKDRTNEWRLSNKEKIFAKAKSWYDSRKNEKQFKDAASSRAREWYAKNRDRAIARQKEYNVRNPENVITSSHNRRARKNSADGSHTAQDIKQLFALQRGKCACCKVGINDGYHVDHVIPLSLGGSNDRLNLQLLCPTCNLQKSAKHPIDFMQSRGFLL